MAGHSGLHPTREAACLISAFLLNSTETPRETAMPAAQPDFTIGIEEEYLLVDRDSLALAPAPPEMMEACAWRRP